MICIKFWLAAFWFCCAFTDNLKFFRTLSVANKNQQYQTFISSIVKGIGSIYCVSSFIHRSAGPQQKLGNNRKKKYVTAKPVCFILFLIVFVFANTNQYLYLACFCDPQQYFNKIYTTTC